MTSSPLFGQDPWIAILVSDFRAAMWASEELRGAERHLDGPFTIWDGKLDDLPVSIVVTAPGGVASWCAASKLMIRRVSPTFLLGVTPCWWSAEAPQPDFLWSTTTYDLSSFRERLTHIAYGIPDCSRQNQGLGNSHFPLHPGGSTKQPSLNLSHIPESASRFPFYKDKGEVLEKLYRFALQKSESSHAQPQEKDGNQDFAPYDISNFAKKVAPGSLACLNNACIGDGERRIAHLISLKWGSHAIDQESAGVGEIAQQNNLPWGIIGACVPWRFPARSLLREWLVEGRICVSETSTQLSEAIRIFWGLSKLFHEDSERRIAQPQA